MKTLGRLSIFDELGEMVNPEHAALVLWDCSARESAIRGFYTIIVSDCVSSSDKTMHEMALKIMQRICLVVSIEEL
jgi:nicotinamidase-related amidase